MYPIALQIGTFSIRWYGIMAAIGFLLACLVISANRKIAKLSSDQASNTLFVAILSGIVGARIFYVVQFFDDYRDNPVSIIRIDQGGLVFYGGFILAIVSLIFYCRKNHLDFIRILDIYTPAIAVAHACGRIGCFLNGCCYGKPAGDAWYAVHYPADSLPCRHYGHVGLYPVQLVEAGEVLLLFVLFFYLVRRLKRGLPTALYLMIYGVLRFLNEWMRGDNPSWIFTPAQWIGLGLIAAGAVLFKVCYGKKADDNI